MAYNSNGTLAVCQGDHVLLWSGKQVNSLDTVPVPSVYYGGVPVRLGIDNSPQTQPKKKKHKKVKKNHKAKVVRARTRARQQASANKHR